MEALTLRELIDALQDLLDTGQANEGDPVHFVYDYGDHWRTRVAKEVKDVNPGLVVMSSYHRMYKVSEDEDDDTKVVVLIE